MRLHDGTEWLHQQMGSRVVGRKFVEITLNPEEIIDAWDESGPDVIYRYLKMLTRHYKKND